MENAVVYARYSSHSQTEQSIEGQISAARKFASEKNYKIIHEYVDRAKTGTNDNREEFQKMLKDSAKRKFTVIIVWKVDRFGRNREEITFNKYKVKKNGVRVEYIAENITPGPEGVILESVLEGMAEYYSLQLSQNVSRGYVESAKKRHVIGMPPLGYVKGDDKKYKIVPEEAEIVRLIYQLYLEGNSQADIIRILNSRHIKNKRGSEFKTHNLNTILNDDRYIGNYRFKGEILEENCIPEIISRDVFYEAKKASKKHLNMNANNWNYSEYKLSDKLFCGKCHSKMKGSSGYGKMGTKYMYYVCPNCGKTRIRADKLDEKVLTYVYSVLDNSEILEEIADKVYRYHFENDETKAEIARIDGLLADNERRTTNILKSIESGLDYKLCKGRLSELEAEKDELIRLKADIELKNPVEVTKDLIYFFLLKFRDNKKDSVIIESLVDKIVISGSEAEISLSLVDTGSKATCSTAFDQMGTWEYQANFLYRVYYGGVTFKMIF